MFSVSFFASSVTQNQIFSFLLGVFLNFLLTIIGTPIVLLSLPQFVVPLISGLSYFTHIDSFSQGMIALSDVVFFLSLMTIFLSFSHAHLARFQRTGSLSWSFLMLKRPLLILASLCVINVGFSFTNFSLDTTASGVNSLSHNSSIILSEVTEPVTVTLYTSDPLPPEL